MTEREDLAFRLKMAKQRADLLLKQEGITSLRVDPFAIAESRDIEVQPKPGTDAGVSGMLLRHGDMFGILYATDIKSEGFQRFSVAHELGHFFLDGHIDHILPNDGLHVSHAGFTSADPYELEADHFAAGLLMPSIPFKRALDRRDPGLEAIESLAELCRTSLTATAIRYSELTEDAAAIVISTGQVIDYCFLSDLVKSQRYLTWLRKGMPVPAGTATTRLNSSPQAVLEGRRADEESDMADWLGGRQSVAALEQVVGLGRYGKTLTVLTFPSLRSEEDEEDDVDDDERTVDRWTPRFRK